MSRALETALDAIDLIPHAYVLEISSPGAARILEGDREFVAFRGFMVAVNMISSYEVKHIVNAGSLRVVLDEKDGYTYRTHDGKNSAHFLKALNK